MNESIDLYCTQGSSDKVYHMQLVREDDDTYTVNVQYGRRGSTLQSITKTPQALPYDKAKKLYDRLLAEKSGKGYTVGTDGTPFQGTDKAGRVSGLLPQLLNPVTEVEAQALILDDKYVAQEKINGERRLLKREREEASGINRKGLVVALPQPIADAVVKTNLPSHFVLDGEAVGDVLYVFDALGSSRHDLTDMSYIERYRYAEAITNAINSDAIRIVPLAVTTAEKKALYEKVKAEGGEGVVFKNKNAPYTVGRPASDGAQRKFKFVETASCLVERVNTGKRSVSLVLLGEAGESIGVGNVTIPPNFTIPSPGAVVEVQYLYVPKKGGSLYQPVYLGERTDIERAACTVGQLKYAPPVAA